jgi:hypothetical protein
MKRLASIPALLALAAFLAACSLPPYNEQLSLAQVTRSKLGQPINRIGPVYAQLDDNARDAQFYFLPDRNDLGTMAGGFLVAEASYGLRAWYLAYWSSYGSLGDSKAVGLENSSGTTNNFLLQPIRSASGASLNLVRYLPSSGYLDNDLVLIRANDPSMVSLMSTLRLAIDCFGNPNLVAAGSSIYPMDSAATGDLQYFLGYATDVGSYIEIECPTSDGLGLELPALGTISSDFTLSPLPPDLRNVFYGHAKSTGLSYLSYWSSASGRYLTYSWTPTTYSGMDPSDLKLLSGVKGRIDAVLSNGQLLSFDGGACTVYGPAGLKLFAFPLGGLKFCYERYTGSTPDTATLYFSLAYWLYGRDEKPDQLYVEVYAIPTANLRDLN